MPADAPDPDDADAPRGPKRHYDEDGAEITPEFATWAMFAHLGQLFFAFLGPLVVLLAYGQKSAFVARHAREAINYFVTLCFQVLVLSVVGGLGAAVGYLLQPGFWPAYIGFCVTAGPLSLALAVVEVILVVKACIAASRYQPYRYPFAVRLIG